MSSSTWRHPQPYHVKFQSAVRAADVFVDFCLQHAAYLGGRGDFKEAVCEIEQGK